jgi:hypothetical protein
MKCRTNDNNFTEVNKGVCQGCPLSPVLFNIYIDKVIKEWQHTIKCDAEEFNSRYNFIFKRSGDFDKYRR